MARSIIAVLPAAGVGSRMQANKPKQYLTLLGKTLLEHTLDVMLSYPAVSKIILAVSKDDPYISTLSLDPKIQLVEGGTTRAESVLNGLNAIAEKNAWVLVHDAARPCLQHADIDKLLAIEDEQGAILAIPATDTIKRADNQQCIVKTKDRSQLWQAMTPQFFPVDILRDALSTGIQQGANITDEASAMELAGFRPHLVAGRSDNLKVTRPEDLALAEFYLTRNKL
ncbi:TPA: 2-C-methyl-D-erythritol 4-phosphate cytidylyltransferase [Haemophilus influenzae]